MPESALNSPNPATESPAPMSNSKVSSASSKKSSLQQSTISLFAVQCGKCLKWRLIDTEEEYEEIRSKSSTDPFVCSKKPNVTCDNDADIEYDTSRTWVIDKPNIPIPPSGFKRKLVMRRDFSKLDAYYITPTGKKLRSGTEVTKYLSENPDIKGASADAFSFQVPKIDEETVPKHVERKSSARAEKRARDAKDHMDSRDSSANSKRTYVLVHNVLCRCQPLKNAEIKISESVNNPNRMYYKCADCEFFKWFNDSAIQSSCESEWINLNRAEAVVELLRKLFVVKKEIRTLISVGLKFGAVCFVVLFIILVKK